MADSRLIKAYRAEQSKTKENHSLKPSMCLPDQTYHSKVFYIRFREEKADLSEIIHFFNDNAEALGSLTIELWFFERTSQEIQQKKPITPLQSVEMFKLVSSKKIGFKKDRTLEHFTVIFDTGFTSALEINILSIQKYPFSIFSNLSIQMSGQKAVHQHPITEETVTERKQIVTNLQKIYDSLRSLYDGLGQLLPSWDLAQNFGPLRFDNSSRSATPFLGPTIERFPTKNIQIDTEMSDETETLREKFLKTKVFRTNLNNITSRICPETPHDDDRFINLKPQLVQHCKKVSKNQMKDGPISSSSAQQVKTLENFEPKTMMQVRTPIAKQPKQTSNTSNQHGRHKINSLFTLPVSRSPLFANQQAHYRRNSDEISSSSSEQEALSSNLCLQKQQHKNIKSLICLQNIPSPKKLKMPTKPCGDEKEEDIPFIEYVQDKQRQVLGSNLYRKPGGKQNLVSQIQTANANATKATYLIQEIWQVIQKTQFKALPELNTYLKRKYTFQQHETLTRIIVAMDEEDSKLRMMSIRQSGIRKVRRQPFQQEVEQEAETPMPNKRGQRPNLLKLPQQANIPNIRAQRMNRCNLSQQPLTPSNIEKSMMLARSKRLDVSVQPEVPPLLPNKNNSKEQPSIFLDEKVKESTEPIIIEEVYYDDENLLQTINMQDLGFKSDKERPSHLFVFVHGFQATSCDMQMLKNHLQILVPQAMFLISKSNEKLTEKDITKLGLNLATEVKTFIKHYFSHFKQRADSTICYLKKLTFVAHSLGGIIVRESLKHLTMYKEQFHGFVSLGSPHLGYMYNSSSLVDAGMWILKNWTQSDSLRQLTMTDSEKFEDSFLYKLSECPHIGHFKYMILVGSFQDSYVPYDSARIQVCLKAVEKETKNRQTYLKMADNILSKLQCKQLWRLDVNFKIEATTFANMIGRTAHIQMIESEQLIQAIIHKYQEVFCV